jgi:DNA-binding IclR family transcriptional regulator
MLAYVAGQYAFDLEDNEPSIRCVAAPVRDASQRIVAAISVASTVPYMSLERMQQLTPAVQAAARSLSQELGG